MKNMFLFILLIFFSLSSFAWEKITIVDGITIEFPQKPKLKDKIIRIKGKNFIFKQYKYRTKLEVFSVSYAPYPENIASSTSRNKILDAGVSGSVKNIQGEKLSESVFTINGYPGREYSVLGPNRKHILNNKVIALDEYLLTINYMSTKNNMFSSNSHKFLNSISLQ